MILTFYYGSYCTIIDPTDEIVIKEKIAQANKLIFIYNILIVLILITNNMITSAISAKHM